MKHIKDFWCYKVLPLVYDSSLSYYEILTKFVTKLNEVIEWVDAGLKTIPTKTSQLTNDSGFLTNANIPTKTSQLTNDSGFVNEEEAASAAPVQSVNGNTGDVNTFNFGVCESGAGAQEKTVTINGITTLTEGLIIHVLFTNENTVSTIQLNVNNLGAYYISTAGIKAPPANYWVKNQIVEFVFHDSRWIATRGGAASTTEYGITKLSSSTTSTSTTLAATPSAVKAVKDAIPTKVSDLTNDSGFITDEDVPTATSELDNDSGFITKDGVLSWSNVTYTDTLAQAQAKLLTTPGYFRTWTYSGDAAYAPSNDANIDYTFTAYARASDGINRLYFTAIDMTHGIMYIATPDGRWVEQQNLAVPVEIPANSNLNDYTTPGTYTVLSGTIAATVANSPITSVGYRLWVVQLTPGYFIQVALPNTTLPRFFMRRMQPSASSYSDWTPQARMADVQQRFTEASLTANTPVTVSLPASCKAYYLIIGTNNTHMGCGLINCTSTTAFHRKVLDATDVTVSTSGLNLIVTNTVTATTRLYVFIVSS